MKTNDIKKGMKIKSVQLGQECSGIMADNMRGNRRMVDVKGSELGLFDEIGSVYSHDIVWAKGPDGWVRVEHTPAQKALREEVKNYF
tara:strand:- start:501 stop:761 length:261 start_codon:yes stop_codon:yes gene_type:complete